MRAFAIDEFGAPGSIRELPEPTPGDGQVRVRVEAASINPADVSMIGGMFKDFMEHHFPLIPGLDLGGVVDVVGPGVGGLRVGDPVFGVHGKRSVGEGTLAGCSIAQSTTIARRPSGIDAAFGAALSLAGVSALQMFDAAAPGRGDTVLVIGATGGVGSIALQLLAAAGARPIAVTRQVNGAYALDLGAVETIDYETQDVFAVVRAAHPTGIAAIFDMAGDKASIGRLTEVVRTGGHVVSMMRTADIEALAARGISGTNVVTQATTDKLERLAGFVAAGKLRRPEIRELPLADAGAALAEIAGRHVRGKLVIIP
jgi:NADPH:quinone reductase-like Zn-dependent oxidoreductase